jgi:ubiquinone/menaquinone biosynthesis C-methylase UbiE
VAPPSPETHFHKPSSLKHMLKSRISAALRKLGLLYAADTVRFWIEKWRHAARNRRFRRQHPDFVLPPDYLLYESFRLDYEKYYQSGKAAATWLAALIQKHTARPDPAILDWGCGPGRVIRHLSALFPDSRITGSDYNTQSIRWCSSHLSGVTFIQNELNPPLQVADNSQDVLYGISIFTHLSEHNHNAWAAEIHRVLRSNGIAIISTQGDNFIPLLTEKEAQSYLQGELVVRGMVKEGHRTFSAFQPNKYMMNSFNMFDVVEHQMITPTPGSPLPQDIWVFKKR